jgi:hypothetical protein
MKNLFSCLGGSSLYGTTHADSDRDIKRIVLPDLNALILGHPIKNIMIKTNTVEGQKNGPDDVDQELIPVHTFARDFLGGQTYALELAWAVEYEGAEQHLSNVNFLYFCRELRTKFMTSSVSAMTGYAVEQANKYSFKGQRLQSVAELEKILQSFPGGDRLSMHRDALEKAMEPLVAEFPECVEVTQYDSNGKGAMMSCLRILEKTLPYTGTFAYNLRSVQSLHKRYGDRSKKAAASKGDWKATMHAVRVIDEGIRLFTEGNLVFPFPDPAYIEFLHTIRRGEHTSEQVDAMIDARFETLAALKEASSLPTITEELTEQLEAWLLTWVKEFYNLR